MARKRMIDPNIWTDERFMELDHFARLFFIGLISNADDEGRMLWSARQLQGKIFPADQQVTVNDMLRAMEAVRTCELAHVYEADGRQYAHLPGWLKNQNINRPQESKLPAPGCCPGERLNGFTDPSLTSKTSGATLQNRSVPDEDRGREDRSGEGRTETPRVLEEDAPKFGPLEADVETFVTLAAGENRTGKISEGRAASIRRELQEVLTECADLRAFRDGLREANSKGKPNVNYVRACVRSAQMRSGAIEVLPKRRAPQRGVNTWKMREGSDVA